MIFEHVANQIRRMAKKEVERTNERKHYSKKTVMEYQSSSGHHQKRYDTRNGSVRSSKTREIYNQSKKQNIKAIEKIKRKMFNDSHAMLETKKDKKIDM